MSTEINLLRVIADDHKNKINYGLASINSNSFEQAAKDIFHACMNKRNIFVIGNGASAAMASHWACDVTKGCSKINVKFTPRVISLAENIPLITAIANDIDYESIYSYQLERMAEENDILVAISSSGSSPNIVKAVETANELNMSTICLTGFHGGKCKELAHISLHVDLHEYEATEDVHSAILHIFRKYTLGQFSNV